MLRSCARMVALSVALVVGLAVVPSVDGAPRPKARWERLEIEITRTPDAKQEKVKKEFRFGFRVSYNVTDEGAEIMNFEYTGASIPTTQDRVWATEYAREVRRKHKAGEEVDYLTGVPLKSKAEQILDPVPVEKFTPLTTSGGKKGFLLVIRWSIHDVEDGTVRLNPRAITKDGAKRLLDEKADPTEFMGEFGGFRATSGICSSGTLDLAVVEGEYRVTACLEGSSVGTQWTPVPKNRTNPFLTPDSENELASHDALVTVQWKPRGTD